MIVILAIGNEIVSGQTLNSNGFKIAAGLTRLGHTVLYQQAVRDDNQIIKDAFKEALSKATYVICTGGLGPTIDDITRDVAADYFHSPLYLDEKIKAELEERFKGRLHTVDQQAMVPDKAIIMPNPIGTAPGFIFEDSGKALFLLPGIPNEMETMLNKTVIPYIEKRAPSSRPFTKQLNLFNLSESKVDPALRLLKGIDIGIYPQAGIVNVVLKSLDSDKLDAAFDQLLTIFKDNHFIAPSGRIEEGVHNLLIQQNKTLGLAESMTGGALSARLTSLSGSSQYLLGGIVSYSNESKVSLLDVPRALIESDGAVSESVAKAMAFGAKQKLKTDYALSVTGVAGPTGGTENKPVGTVWCALASSEGVRSWKLEGRSSRTLIIDRSVNSMLAELYLELSQPS